MNSEFLDLLREFNAANAEYLIVGAHAVNFHARPRATKDFDVLVNPTAENARRVYAALARFGAPLDTLTVEDLEDRDLIFQIGVEPIRIDVITEIDGVTFDEAWRNKIDAVIAGVPVHVIGKSELIANKRAAGRPRDLGDVERLTKDR